MSVRVGIRTVSVGVLGCVLTVSGCGQSTQSTSSVGAPPAWTQRFERADRVATSLSNSIRGTAEQRSAKQYESLWRLNNGFDACMRSHGVAWNPWRKVENVSVSDGLPTWLRRPMQPVVSQSVLLQARLVRAMDVPPSDPLTGHNGVVLDHCLTTSERNGSGGAAHDHLGSLIRPAYTSSTARAFARLVDSATRGLGSEAGYARCMKQAGSPVESSSDDGRYVDLGVATERLERTRPALHDIPEPGQTGSPAWQRFLDREQALLRDDASCRRSEYEKGMARLAPQLDGFRRQHARELSRLRAFWRSVDQEAQKHGWPVSY